jgi:hypothetical protein
MIIATDFDGTIVTHEYPKIGNELPFAIDTLKLLIQEHHRVILWTVREGRLLDEAVEWCRERGVEFYAVNRDYPEEDPLHLTDGFSRKIKADLFIDDRNLGGLPDWGTIYRMVHSGRPHHQLPQQSAYDGDGIPKRKSFFEILFGSNKRRRR